MRSFVRSRGGGFTLLEVVVALGVLAGALLLVGASQREGVARGARAREALGVLASAESKFAECVGGIERAPSGELPDRPGYRWEFFRTPSTVAGLKRLGRVRFVVRDLEGGKVFDWEGFVHGEAR